jgi:SAM-dependent methyltransferase
MRIFFTTPYSGKHHYQSFIDEILATLQKNKAAIITPENSLQYQAALEKLEYEGLTAERARYAHTSHSIAEADIVIIEASYEDFRVGHEATLALLYSKPTLILSQHVDYSQYIPHELLFGKRYQTKSELRHAVQEFLTKADDYLGKASETTQAIGGAADSLHMATLASLRHGALRDTSEFGTWARLAEQDSHIAYTKIQKALGDLPVGRAWSIFAPVYNEDTPDYIFSGVASFIHATFKKHKIRFSDPICDVATGTGGLARNLVNLGYRNIAAFDESREMLAEAFRLCAHLPSIKLLEANITNVRLPAPVKAMAWIDFSSNFALTPRTLHDWIKNLIDNLVPGGLLMFDVRTVTGWQVTFFHQKVTTFATPNFQRIWINLPDYDQRTITFDIFIRTRQSDGNWGHWQREQMKERMWHLKEVHDIASSLPNCTIEAVFDDSFSPITHQEPGLAYFLLKKIPTDR